MKKSLLYTALGLMGIMGTLAIGVVNAESQVPEVTVETYSISEPYGNITYKLNGNEQFEAKVITITDGTDIITILDRNLGAEKAGTGCDYKTNGNKYCPYDDTYGYHFQWGNNHGFKPGCDLSGSTDHCSDTITSSAVNGQVDATTISYNPANQVYYESGVFYKGYYNWLKDNSKIDLRGGSTGGTDTIKSTSSLNGDNWKVDESTVKNRQGPCPEGFHVPSIGELNKLRSMLESDSKRNTGVLHNELLIPFAGFRNYNDASVYYMGNNAYLWSSSPYSYFPYSRYLGLNVVDSLRVDILYRANAYSVRCFYDSYQPFTQSFILSFISDGEEVGTGEVTEDMTGAIPEEVTDKIEGMTNTTKTGYVLEYRYLSGADPIAEFDFTGTAITGGMADDDGNVYFIAQWTGIKYEIKFEAGGGTGTMENQTFTYHITGTLTPNAFTKNGYTFSGWTDSEGNKYTDGQEVNNLTTTGGEVITLTAEWTKNKTSGGSSGGGGSMKKDNCPDGDLSPSYYDGTCEGANVSSGTDVKDLEGDTQDSSAKPQNDVTPLTGGDGEARGGYSQEFLNAYERAFKNGITTMNTIDKANMDGYIKRGHLAKMVVNYVTNVLGREIPSDIPASCLSFNDESTVRESEEIKDYAIKSCALGLMGIRMKNNEFLPNDYVTRAEFGAVLSRILRGDKYNLVGTADKPRYSDHLNALKEEGIMTKIDNPQMQEKRGYVMIMLMRSAKGK